MERSGLDFLNLNAFLVPIDTHTQDGVQNLFGRVFGGEALPETVSGGSVTDSNIMTFLGMVEEKTNNLLQVR